MPIFRPESDHSTLTNATPHRNEYAHLVSVFESEPIDKMKEEEILSSFRERYTAVKRLAITPVEAASNEHGDTTSVATSTGERGVCVMVQFTGPQPSQGPATLLRNLLRGTSVQAQPVELGRGRKKKRTRSDGLPVCVGDGASDAKRLNDDNNKSRLKVKGKFETEKDTTSSGEYTVVFVPARPAHPQIRLKHARSLNDAPFSRAGDRR